MLAGCLLGLVRFRQLVVDLASQSSPPPTISMKPIAMIET
jgi:hypothetical protein